MRRLKEQLTELFFQILKKVFDWIDPVVPYIPNERKTEASSTGAGKAGSCGRNEDVVKRSGRHSL